jgi:hypothetical protein
MELNSLDDTDEIRISKILPQIFSCWAFVHRRSTIAFFSRERGSASAKKFSRALHATFLLDEGPKTFSTKIARGGAFPLDDLRGSRKINVNA